MSPILFVLVPILLLAVWLPGCNQGGIKSALTGKASEKARGRVDNMLADLNKKGEEIPVQVLMATQKDEFRKPGTGMWDFFVQNLNKGVQPDLSQCYYVGDMAGRPTDVGDGQASDREFAKAVGIEFFLPEDKFGESQGKKEFRTDAASPAKGQGGKNAALAAAFTQLAELVSGEAFKANAFRKVADIIENWPSEITAASDLKNVKGVGKSSMAKITEFLQTGTLAALSEAGIEAGAARPVDKAAEVGLKFL